ncbi:hypothetical protein PENTCL1PPCAC_12090, partial [Pristionchus entomophagus]
MSYGHDSVWIRPVEVIPAVESLYLQYHTLRHAEAKAFIDSFLESWKGQYERHDLPMSLANESYSFSNFVFAMNGDIMGINLAWIMPIEVSPAIELLYIQYRTLINNDAKSFIDAFLEEWKGHYEQADFSN